MADDPKDAFRNHRSRAKRRGIPFLLTYEEWLSIWEASGHLHEKGRGADKYCMGRYDDRGPYAVGNVEIITNRRNWHRGLRRGQRRYTEEELREL
jgi:hypothetical protein